MQPWILDFHAPVEALRLDDVIARMTPDVEVTVGNNPTLKGRQAARDGIGGLFAAIAGLKHHYLRVVESADATFIEMKVEYLRKDGHQVTVPVCTVLERRDELVSALRIYLDIGPVFA